ncbi:TPA: hypothetical protein ACGO3A_002239 [Streptococcus suis]
MNKQSDFLAVKNSFISGASRVLDIGSTRNKRVYNTSKNSYEADWKAVNSDWAMVGQDIWGAYYDFKQEIKG